MTVFAAEVDHDLFPADQLIEPAGAEVKGVSDEVYQRETETEGGIHWSERKGIIPGAYRILFYF